MKSSFRHNSLLFIIAIILAGVALFSYLLPSVKKTPEVPLSDVVTMSLNKEIRQIRVEDDALLVTKIDGSEIKAFKEPGSSIYDIKELDLKDVIVEVKGSSGINWGAQLFNFLPLLLFGVLLFVLFRQARGANNQAMSFGRSRAKLFSATRATVTFNDVAGVEEAKQDLQEVVEFLKSREKFQTLGARIPKGVLLVGPPGTGKTLLAKAVAGEADVPFFSISGSEFVEMFVGVGASRVRDLFDQAKRNAPCIIFIDEIDAVGRQRGAGLGGSHDEREQTLNQILVEMDGFDTNTSVIVMAATNRPDILDPALLRPGRFDRRVILDRPDIAGRLAILKVHSNGKPLDPAVKLEVLAKSTVGFSGADLANLVNEGALLSARRNKQAIGMEELEEAIDRVIAGPERKSRRISAKDKEITAYHEAGHALVARLLPDADPVHKISIVARGMSLGHTRQLPIEDRYLVTRRQIRAMICTFLGGNAAEELIFSEVSSGSSDDLKRATDLAHRMVTDLGMSNKLGPRTFGDKQEMVFLGREISEQRDYGDKIADAIDEEVNGIMTEAHETAMKILKENKTKLVSIAQKLMTEETLEGEALEAAFSGHPAPVAQSEVIAQPVPIEPAAETKPATETKPQKAPMIPNILPKPNPAPSDSRG